MKFLDDDPTRGDGIDAALRRRLALGVFALALAVRWAFLGYSGFVVDDAFITLRVARNLATFGAPFYNADEAGMASTSPLWTLLVAVLCKTVGDGRALIAAQLLGGVFDAAAAATVAAIAIGPQPAGSVFRRPAGRPALLGGLVAGGFYALVSTVVVYATAGLETGLHACLVGGTLFFLSRRRFAPAAWTASFAALARPDGVLLLLITWSFVTLSGGLRAWLRSLVAPGIVLLPYAVYAYALHGSVVSQSVAAKTALLREPAVEWGKALHKLVWGSPIQLVFSAACACALILGWRTRRDLLPAWVWLLGFVGGYSSLATWWPWYWPPAFVPYAAIAGCGIGLAAARLRPRLLSPQRFDLACASGALLLAILLAGRTARVARDLREDMSVWLPHVHRVAQSLARVARAGDTVMLEPLGAIGSLVPLRFRDYPGLASPLVSETLRRRGTRIPWKPSDPDVMTPLLDRVRPDVLVLREDEYEALRVGGSLTTYALAETIPVAASDARSAARMGGLVVRVLRRVDPHGRTGR